MPERGKENAPARYAVIGNPVAHSKSPDIHHAFAVATGQDIEYLRIEAPLDGFAETVEALRHAGGRGANVTLPFKAAALTYCAGSVSERARLAGAANTLTFDGGRVRGDNTDGVGLVRDLSANLGLQLRATRVLLLGAGGAAQGVVQPLLAAGIGTLTIVNRTAERARQLAGRFAGVEGCGYDRLEGRAFDLLVNATSAGLKGELPPLPMAAFAPRAFAYEMVYGQETPFMELARRAGAGVSDGLGMLVEQAAESFRIWRGVMPDTSRVLADMKQRRA